MADGVGIDEGAKTLLDFLIDLIGHHPSWGYAVVFLVATLECSAFLGLIVPGESVVLFAGFFASRGLFDLGDLILLVAAGATLGDSIGYEVGLRLGRPWLLHFGRRVGLRPAHLERAEAFFDRHGGKAILLGRFVGFARVLVPFVAGSSRMPYRRFLPWNALGGFLWSASFALLGYFLGESWGIAERWLGRASVLVLGGLILIVALLWIWRWMVRHEAVLRRRWAEALAGPRVAALRRRFAPHLAFLEARLSPGGYLGLHLTAGLIVLVGAGWLFGGIAQDVVAGDPLTLVDRDVSAWLHARTSPPMTAVMMFLSFLAAPLTVTGTTAVTSVFLAWRRSWYRLLALALTVPGGTMINGLLKHAFHRARPAWEDPILVLTSYSFPSGHVMGATLLYGILTAFLVRAIGEWRWRVLTVLTMGLLIMLIGFSRIYLGVHYLSDVLAAIAAGIAWLSLCLTAVETLRRRRLESCAP